MDQKKRCENDIEHLENQLVKTDNQITLDSNHLNNRINDIKLQNEELNIEINKYNNQYLKTNSKIASIKQIQLNLHREQEGVFEQINAIHDSVKNELAHSYTKSYELIDRLNKDKEG